MASWDWSVPASTTYAHFHIVQSEFSLPSTALHISTWILDLFSVHGPLTTAKSRKISRHDRLAYLQQPRAADLPTPYPAAHITAFGGGGSFFKLYTMRHYHEMCTPSWESRSHHHHVCPSLHVHRTPSHRFKFFATCPPPCIYICGRLGPTIHWPNRSKLSLGWETESIGKEPRRVKKKLYNSP